MGWIDGVDFRELVSRFDAGERSNDLVAMLNRAAFECFHAPWETLPHPKPRQGKQGLAEVDLEKAGQHLDDLEEELDTIQLPPSQGRLPMEDADDDEDLHIPRIEPTPRKKGEKPAAHRHASNPNPQDPKAPAERALARLDAALEAMGLQGHTRKDSSLKVDLPYNRKADANVQMMFKAEPEVKHPPAEPGALVCEPLKAAGGVADAAPNCGWPPFGGSPHQGNICSNR
jgi:hypothetical protein